MSNKQHRLRLSRWYLWFTPHAESGNDTSSVNQKIKDANYCNHFIEVDLWLFDSLGTQCAGLGSPWRICGPEVAVRDCKAGVCC